MEIVNVAMMMVLIVSECFGHENITIFLDTGVLIEKRLVFL